MDHGEEGRTPAYMGNTIKSGSMATFTRLLQQHAYIETLYKQTQINPIATIIKDAGLALYPKCSHFIRRSVG